MYERSAELYDLLYEAAGTDFAAEAELVADLVARRAPGAATLLDVGCGTGRHLAEWRHRFACVEGCDASAAMLRRAQALLPDVTLTRADMRTLDLGRRFDAVVSLFSAVGYVLQPAELRETWRRLAAHLEPGGVAVVDGWVRPSAWVPGRRPLLNVAADEERVVARMDHAVRDGDLTTLTLFHLVGTVDGIEAFEETHVLRLVEDAEHLDAMREAGLRADVVEGIRPGRSRFVGVRVR